MVNSSAEYYNLVLTHALNPNIDGKTFLESKKDILENLKKDIGEKLFYRIVDKYALEHLSKAHENLYLSDVRAILVGAVTNASKMDLEDPLFIEFLQKSSSFY